MDVKRQVGKDLEGSGKVTVSSDHSGSSSFLTDQHLKSCLKVPTQQESLARITSSVEKTLLPIHSCGVHSGSEKKILRFANVEFREYARALSDNPSTSSGPPIGIGWNFNPEGTVSIDLDIYERGCEGLRRSSRELTLPRDIRENILREAGYSRSEIVEAVRSVRKDKDRRIVSIQRQKYEPILERIETAKKGIRRWISCRISISAHSKRVQ